MKQSSNYTLTEMQLFDDWKILTRLMSKADRIMDWCSQYLLQFYIYQTQKWERKQNRSHFISTLFNTGIASQKVNFWKLPAFRTATRDSNGSENWFRTATVVCAINYLIKWTHLPPCSSSAMGWIVKIISA